MIDSSFVYTMPGTAPIEWRMASTSTAKNSVLYLHKIAALATCLLLCASMTFGAANAQLVTPVSTVLPLSGPLTKQTMSRILLTDAAKIANRIVAVGDRGYIVSSDNNGDTWERAQTPPNVPMLTAVFFADAKNGWAVGHDAVILKSVDEGKTWAQAFSAPAEQKPLMDILFTDTNTGFAVGAYGAYYETTDAGKTWISRKIKDEDKHFNSIIKLADNHLLMVGEAGTILTSTDTGKTWVTVASPYKGSFFGAILAQDGAVILFGLRGNIYRSADASLKSFKQIVNQSTASIMGATKLSDGTLILTGLAGTVLASSDNGQTFTVIPTPSTKAISVALLGSANTLLLFGETGARDVPLPAKK